MDWITNAYNILTTIMMTNVEYLVQSTTYVLYEFFNIDLNSIATSLFLNYIEIKTKVNKTGLYIYNNNQFIKNMLDKTSYNYQYAVANFNNYRIEPFNTNWVCMSILLLNDDEHIIGNKHIFIEDYQYSFNTLYPYIHYKLKFPNEEISFTKSGNYIIKVYVNNNREDLILTRRFYVVDQKISIKSSVKMATLAKHRDYKQEVDFNLNLNNYPVIDPYADLKVVISQNRRMDNAITNLKPLFVRTPELVYNYERENLFNGNNEFRFFDTKDLRYQAINVDGIQIIDGKTHVYILPEEPRSYKQYFFQNDINGLRLIKRDDSRDANREADYIKTYFTLKSLYSL